MTDPRPARPDPDAVTLTEEDAADSTVDRTAELEERVAALEDRWRRAEADLDNVRKRLARDMAMARAEERGRLAAQWLPVLDNLDRALDNARAEPDAIIDGVRAVRDQGLAVLAGLGFPRQNVRRGETFDPARHEAVATTPATDVAAGAVVDVVLPGYGPADERQLRPAAVVVAARAHTPDADTPDADTPDVGGG